MVWGEEIRDFLSILYSFSKGDLHSEYSKYIMFY